MDNFDDFAPSSKSSSTLASIFGKSSNASESPSLIYTPTKQPRREPSPKKTTLSDSTALNAKLELILVKSVHAYKLSSGAYQPLGKMGLALVGCPSPPVYQLLLYKTKEDVVCKIRIRSNDVFSVLDNNYASFYSEDQANYSVMFESAVDVEVFAQQYAVIKGALSSQMIVQDLLFSKDHTIPQDGQIPVKVTPCQLLGDKATPVADMQEFQLHFSIHGSQIWVEGLREMKFGAKRVVILPKEYDGPWSEHLEPQGKLLLRVEIPKQPADEKSDLVSSSGEESASFKEKGAIIEGAIAGKSQKSGLLSRVARLGQATLPLRGAVAADMTDSEDDSSPSPKPRTRIKPPAAALRELPLRAVEKPIDSVALYQQQYPSQIVNPGYGAMLATTPTSLLSPLDSSLSAHFSESRTQAAELRMGLSKVSDKVDVVISKLDKVNKIQPQNIAYAPPADGAGILASVQALVEGNQKLRDKVEEQKIKIDAQSERIYHLLELSHKSLEQTSTIHKPQDDKLQRTIIDLEEKLEKARSETMNVREMLDTANSSLKNSELEITELTAKLSAVDCEKKEAERKRDELLEELQQSRSENKQLQQELLDKESSGKAEADLRSSQLADELKAMKQLVLESENLQTKVSQMTVENSELKSELEIKVAQLSELKHLGTDGSDTKALMNRVYKMLHSEFQAESQYSGIAIKQVLASVIKELTLEFLQQPTPDVAQAPVEPQLGLAQISPHSRHATELESPSTMNKLEEENKITYNQVWQTNEPPPLPTFDEEEEHVWC